MYKGLSPGLAALMGLAVAGTTEAEAAPFTGHSVTISIGTTFDSNFLSKTTTVLDDPLNPELSAADNAFFSVDDFLDIGPDFFTLYSDGVADIDILDVTIDFSGSTDIDFTNFSIATSGSIGFSFVDLQSDRILIDGIFWDAGAITISGIEAVSEAPSSVPEPEALTGLGLGLLGMAGAGAARRRKKDLPDQKGE